MLIISHTSPVTFATRPMAQRCGAPAALLRLASAPQRCPLERVQLRCPPTIAQMDQEDGRKLKRQAQQERRKQAVRLHRRGMAIKDIAGASHRKNPSPAPTSNTPPLPSVPSLSMPKLTGGGRDGGAQHGCAWPGHGPRAQAPGALAGTRYKLPRDSASLKTSQVIHHHADNET